MKKLRDIVPDEMKLLLVGINPGLRSAAFGHHFAGRGNPFWRLMHASGLTPRLLTFKEDEDLADFGIGLTNLCARESRTAGELEGKELDAGVRTLKRKIARWKPRVVGFVGLTVYQRVFKCARCNRSDKKVSGGAGAKVELLSGARVFVVPNPSGLNASFPGFQSKLVWFEKLARFMDELDAS